MSRARAQRLDRRRSRLDRSDARGTRIDSRSRRRGGRSDASSLVTVAGSARARRDPARRAPRRRRPDGASTSRQGWLFIRRFGIRRARSSTACCGGSATERMCGQGWSAVSTRDTSGVVVIALSPGVHRPHSTRYTSWTGHEGVPRDRPRHAAASRGRDHAASRARPCRPPAHRRQRGWRAERDAADRVVSTHGTHSLVHCELVTGRTHQIRVHLAARGWPIVGDATYGSRDPSIARQALHAWRLTLPHPASREPLIIEAPMPSDMQTLIRGLEGAAPLMDSKRPCK